MTAVTPPDPRRCAAAAAFILLCAGFCEFAAAATVGTQGNATCLTCHARAVRKVSRVDPKEYGNSIHGPNLCVSCHTDASAIPHPAKLAGVKCANCHRLETLIYLNSDHARAIAKGVSEAATCTSCHGKTHTLLSARDERSPVHRTKIASTCGVCHADPEQMKEFHLSQKEPYATYVSSAHGQAFAEGKFNAATCPDCHGTHDLHGAANPDSKVFRARVPVTCGNCHENVRIVFQRSTHGVAVKAGIKEAPVCTDCHGEHTIRRIWDPASSVARGEITETCSNCHASRRIIAKLGLPENRIDTYKDSYHGLAGSTGDMRAANCASCHGWHDVLPATDPASSIHPDNLPKTCGKCHAGMETKKLEGKIHGGERTDQKLVIRVVRLAYLILIPLIVGGMFIHNFADYLRKALSNGTGPHDGVRADAHADVTRMTGNERIQHAFLVATFVTLAHSGFALHFPDAWWSYPYRLGGGELFRKSVHRWTALVFILTGAYHAAYMLGTRRGRELLFDHFFPKFRDALDPLRLLFYNFWLRRQKASLPYPSYIEKAEYWALVWGSVVMVLTGLLLVFNDLTLRYFPLWVSNLATLIHLLEAVLACLSILVWHFYWVIFDPDVYPMNWAWLSGKLHRKARRPQQP